jgi:hypothetical protein
MIHIESVEDFADVRMIAGTQVGGLNLKTLEA